MRFVKMHGLGNDYVFVGGPDDDVPEPPVGWPALARLISERRRGIGSDGLIVLGPPRTHDHHLTMRIFNADGSEAEMCGNGLRCAALLAHDALARNRHAPPLRVRTLRGVLECEILQAGRDRGVLAGAVRVGMGPPALGAGAVGARPEFLHSRDPENAWRCELRPAPTGLDEAEACLVSMGNPHAVFFGSRGAPDLSVVGPAVERHPAFPSRINAHFCRVEPDGVLSVRTWERGSGETAACGTGACAAAVAAVSLGFYPKDHEITVELPGGRLGVRWSDAGVAMTGPAREAYRGLWPEE